MDNKKKEFDEMTKEELLEFGCEPETAHSSDDYEVDEGETFEEYRIGSD
jgi:hypothetical protein